MIYLHVQCDGLRWNIQYIHILHICKKQDIAIVFHQGEIFLRILREKLRYSAPMNNGAISARFFYISLTQYIRQLSKKLHFDRRRKYCHYSKNIHRLKLEIDLFSIRFFIETGRFNPRCDKQYTV